jgi:hypothetical protein
MPEGQERRDMDIVGDRRFVEIPGDKLHALPPLLVRGTPAVKRLDKVMDMASDIVESEELLADNALDDLNPEIEMQRRRMDLAINLVEQYLTFLSHWQWGNGIVEWIRQCETTFQYSQTLRNVLRADVWPHASRCSFVTLLADKEATNQISCEGIDLERAVGLRLTFRQPPAIRCFSNQFLFYLNSTVATSAYNTWAQLAPAPVSSLPPERFDVRIEKLWNMPE